ncbi:pyridoxal phosphate-dependent aminotransferase [Planococcus lenghuensis]|uniref:Aminotransferase n=1 Tax=Planococcus lenghuensis TaxID=2213202 RepID=A0A1Q2L164_9BACL|nr:aminotransferase class I/II-fold pyridoxal phosphate-dependent enzyme [Planococcus lenghuensis]AQQ54179.1 hypothetical protein B0X71_14410 [Planococcus lenghuensis]
MSLLSKRDEIKRNGIREIMELASAIDGPVIELQIGQPIAEIPSFVKAAAIQAIQDNFSSYTANAGIPSLRKAIVNRMQSKYGVEIGLNNVVVSPGAVAALNIVLLSIVDVGEEVLIPDPAYPNYDSLIRIQNAIPKYYPTDPNNEYLPELDKLEDMITEKTKAIIVNSPSNPTGAVLEKDTYKKLIEIARKRNIYIISDEIYDELVYEKDHISALSVDSSYNDFIICVYGFSKTFAMTGWRLGYAILPDHLYSITTKLQEPITTCASSISQKAGEAALTSPLADEFVKEMNQLYRKKRDLACELLDKYETKFVKPNGAFYIIIDISETNMDSMDFAKSLLIERKVAVAPCSTFGPSGDNMIRICFAGDEEKLKEGIEALGEFYQEKVSGNNEVEQLAVE